MALKLIIAGSRTFSDYEYLCKTLNAILTDYDIECVLCGMAKGADTLGEKWAKENNITVEYYPANWDEYGKSAGYKRNVMMAEDANALVAFWDGKSIGTKHMLDIAKKNDLNVFQVLI